jgi:multiple sugar transport system substrate-binding protein
MSQKRRTLPPVVGACAGLVLLATACGGDGGGADGDVELRFSWWGADDRHATTQEVIEIFEEQNPGVTITADYTDWDAYWDRLATATAGGDAPDIITQEERFLREYSDRGALLDLNELDIDMSSLDELVEESGDVEGARYGVATGVNVFSIMADPQAFDEAGVDLPDDGTWTWQDYIDLSAEISEATDGEVVGSQSMGYNENSFSIYARQQGEALYTPDGELGFSEDTLTEWFEIVHEMQETGGQPGADESVEIEAGGPDQSVIATNSGAMAHFWSNQLGGIAATADREVELLRYPGESEFERTGMYFKPAMYYSISSETDHPEEAAAFVDFLVNSEDAAELILADRGLSVNTEVRDSVADSLPEADQQSADFLDELRSDIVDGPPPPPVGAGDAVEIIKRITDDVQFGEITPEEAAERFMTELGDATGS